MIFPENSINIIRDNPSDGATILPATTTPITILYTAYNCQSTTPPDVHLYLDGTSNNLLDSESVKSGSNFLSYPVNNTAIKYTESGSAHCWINLIYTPYDVSNIPTFDETIEEIENTDTGASFFVEKTLNYGDSIIIWFLTLFTFFMIFKIIHNFFWKK